MDKCSYLLSHLAGPATNYLTRAQGYSLQWAGVKCPVRPEILRLWFPDVWLSSPLGAGGTRKQLWAADPGRLHLPGCSQLCDSAWNPQASFPLLLTTAPWHGHESVGSQEFPQWSLSFVRCSRVTQNMRKLTPDPLQATDHSP